MPREYKHMKQYEKEILELKAQGKSNIEISEKFGLTKKQLEGLINRHNRNRDKILAGIAVKPKGRPRKDGTKLPPSIQQLSKVTQLQYTLASKERYIKRLEMENDLIRDFLSQKERK